MTVLMASNLSSRYIKAIIQELLAKRPTLGTFLQISHGAATFIPIFRIRAGFGFHKIELSRQLEWCRSEHIVGVIGASTQSSIAA
jgi:hypothetical protein